MCRVFCRDRASRVLLGFLPVLGTGYTEEQLDEPGFKERAFEVLQQALQVVSNILDIR